MLILEIWLSYLNVTDSLKREWRNTEFSNDLSVLNYCVSLVGSETAER